jgi:hypothetical protein
MKSNQLKLVVALGGFAFLAYLASYLVCRSVYATREDEFITYYNQPSLIGQLSYAFHAPLWEMDSVINRRHTRIGKWRDQSEEIAIRETAAAVWFGISTVGAIAILAGLRLLSHPRIRSLISLI